MNKEINLPIFSQKIFLAKKMVATLNISKLVYCFVFVLGVVFFPDSIFPFFAFAGFAESKKEGEQEEGEQEEEKKSENHKEKTYSFEDIKKLQQIISEKDLKIRELGKKEINSEELSEKLQKLLDKENSKELEISFPDIPPSLLLGKTQEECELLAKDIRLRAQKIYGDSSFFSEKKYTSIADIDSDIQIIKDDKKMSAIAKGIEVMKLSRLKNRII